jgi:hypothetical protein
MRAAVLLLASTGCLSMNTYETARTLEPGRMSHTVGLTSFVPADGTKAPVPMVKYGFHAGVTDGLELGVHVGLPGQLRVLGKYNPLRTEYFDLAISPGAWLTLVPHDADEVGGAALIGADLPLILDVNLADWVTVIPWAGPGIAYSPQGNEAAPIVRAGLGLQFRVGRSVRLHPELSTVIDPIRGEPVDYAFGFAVSLGGGNQHWAPDEGEGVYGAY